MLNQDLVSYIQKQKAAGIPESVYRPTLVAQGWKDEEITEASFLTGSASIPTPIPAPVSDSSDATLAKWSFWLLVVGSIAHIVLTILPNVRALLQESIVTQPRNTILLFTTGYIFVVILPILVTYLPYRRGKFKKQLLLTVILFTLCQIISRFLIIVFFNIPVVYI